MARNKTMNNAPKRNTADAQAKGINTLDLYPAEVAEKRTDDLLRTLLDSPPEPFTPKAKPAKQPKT